MMFVELGNEISLFDVGGSVFPREVKMRRPYLPIPKSTPAPVHTGLMNLTLTLARLQSWYRMFGFLLLPGGNVNIGRKIFARPCISRSLIIYLSM